MFEGSLKWCAMHSWTDLNSLIVLWQIESLSVLDWMNLRLGRSYEVAQSVLDQQVCLITLEVEEVIHSKPQFGDLSDSKN